MRFMTLVRGPENFGPPPAGLLEAINKLGEEALAAGVMVDTGGLAPSATGAKVRYSKGKVSVTDGPFSETKELIGGYAVYDVESREEALKWTVRFMELHKDYWPEWEGETELRQIFGPDDFPF
jgi:hypothetical protein